MKLLRYSRKNENAAHARLGVLMGRDNLVADLRAGYALYLVEKKGNPKGEQIAEIFMPAYLAQFLHLGEAGWEALAEAYLWLSDAVATDAEAPGLDGEDLFIPLEECRLYAPLRPSKLIAIGRNYPAAAGTEPRQRGVVPGGFVKVSSSIIGPGRDILKPAVTSELDCETELAIVIGKKCRNVPEEEAMEVIAGFTIVNDVTARDVGRDERLGGSLLVAKNFDTFCPLGPWLVTRDELPDPMNLRIRTRVNGELRQTGTTADMLWPIPKLVSYLSQMTLMPGDIISTGSPGGGAAARGTGRFLNAGDVIEAEVEGVGLLVNAVVDEPR